MSCHPGQRDLYDACSCVGVCMVKDEKVCNFCDEKGKSLIFIYDNSVKYEWNQT